MPKDPWTYKKRKRGKKKNVRKTAAAKSPTPPKEVAPEIEPGQVEIKPEPFDLISYLPYKHSSTLFRSRGDDTADTNGTEHSPGSHTSVSQLPGAESTGPKSLNGLEAGANDVKVPTKVEPVFNSFIPVVMIKDSVTIESPCDSAQNSSVETDSNSTKRIKEEPMDVDSTLAVTKNSTPESMNASNGRYFSSRNVLPPTVCERTEKDRLLANPLSEVSKRQNEGKLLTNSMNARSSLPNHDAHSTNPPLGSIVMKNETDSVSASDISSITVNKVVTTPPISNNPSATILPPVDFCSSSKTASTLKANPSSLSIVVKTEKDLLPTSSFHHMEPVVPNVQSTIAPSSTDSTNLPRYSTVIKAEKDPLLGNSSTETVGSWNKEMFSTEQPSAITDDTSRAVKIKRETDSAWNEPVPSQTAPPVKQELEDDDDDCMIIGVSVKAEAEVIDIPEVHSAGSTRPNSPTVPETLGTAVERSSVVEDVAEVLKNFVNCKDSITPKASNVDTMSSTDGNSFCGMVLRSDNHSDTSTILTTAQTPVKNLVDKLSVRNLSPASSDSACSSDLIGGIRRNTSDTFSTPMLTYLNINYKLNVAELTTVLNHLDKMNIEADDVPPHTKETIRKSDKHSAEDFNINTDMIQLELIEDPAFKTSVQSNLNFINYPDASENPVDEANLSDDTKARRSPQQLHEDRDLFSRRTNCAVEFSTPKSIVSSTATAIPGFYLSGPRSNQKTEKTHMKEKMESTSNFSNSIPQLQSNRDLHSRTTDCAAEFSTPKEIVSSTTAAIPDLSFSSPSSNRNVEKTPLNQQMDWNSNSLNRLQQTQPNRDLHSRIKDCSVEYSTLKEIVRSTTIPISSLGFSSPPSNRNFENTPLNKQMEWNSNSSNGTWAVDVPSSSNVREMFRKLDEPSAKPYRTNPGLIELACLEDSAFGSPDIPLENINSNLNFINSTKDSEISVNEVNLSVSKEAEGSAVLEQSSDQYSGMLEYSTPKEVGCSKITSLPDLSVENLLDIVNKVNSMPNDKPVNLGESSLKPSFSNNETAALVSTVDSPNSTFRDDWLKLTRDGVSLALNNKRDILANSQSEVNVYRDIVKQVSTLEKIDAQFSDRSTTSKDGWLKPASDNMPSATNDETVLLNSPSVRMYSGIVNTATALKNNPSDDNYLHSTPSNKALRSRTEEEISSGFTEPPAKKCKLYEDEIPGDLAAIQPSHAFPKSDPRRNVVAAVAPVGITNVRNSPNVAKPVQTGPKSIGIEEYRRKKGTITPVNSRHKDNLLSGFPRQTATSHSTPTFDHAPCVVSGLTSPQLNPSSLSAQDIYQNPLPPIMVNPVEISSMLESATRSMLTPLLITPGMNPSTFPQPESPMEISNISPSATYSMRKSLLPTYGVSERTFYQHENSVPKQPFHSNLSPVNNVLTNRTDPLLFVRENLEAKTPAPSATVMLSMNANPGGGAAANHQWNSLKKPTFLTEPPILPPVNSLPNRLNPRVGLMQNSDGKSHVPSAIGVQPNTNINGGTSIHPSNIRKMFHSLLPMSIKSIVGKGYVASNDVYLIITEWNVDWMLGIDKDQKDPPFTLQFFQVRNSYKDHIEYYNTYFPLLLLECWHKICEKLKWVKRNESSMGHRYRILSFESKQNYIRVLADGIIPGVEFHNVPRQGSIALVRFAPLHAGSIKMLAYVHEMIHRPYAHDYDHSHETLKFMKSAKRTSFTKVKLSFYITYSTDAIDRTQLIKVHPLTNIKRALQQTDALRKLEELALCGVILHPLEHRLLTLTLSSTGVESVVQTIADSVVQQPDDPQICLVRTAEASNTIDVVIGLSVRLKMTGLFVCCHSVEALTALGAALNSDGLVIIYRERGSLPQFLQERTLDFLTNQIGEPGLTQSDTLRAVLGRCSILLTLASNSYLENINDLAEEFPYSCCIIVQANLFTEPETLCPLQYDIKKLVLMGDPDVACEVPSSVARSYEYNKSLFHRLFEIS